MGSLDRVAETFRIINIDADPDEGNFTPEQIAVLRARGRNRVISYLNLGSCERSRSYWKTAPSGFVPCGANRKAHRGAYAGYSDETWMDVADADYQRLMVDHVAQRLVAAGVDGFFLDNLEIVEHGPTDRNGACDARCRQGGLELVARLRAAFPDHLIVMQNATSDVTRLGHIANGRFADLLDGIAHESVYAPKLDRMAERELLAWQGLRLRPGGHPFFIGVEDYVGSCRATSRARRAHARASARGFSFYAADRSAGQQVVCFWPFLAARATPRPLP